MKLIYILSTILFYSTVSFGNSGIPHPLDFKGTNAEKKKVISYIESQVKKTYTKVGMNDPLTLRMMEQEELKKFKMLTKITNRKLLNKVIQQYCNIGMCDYSTIHMMYIEQAKASTQKLEW